VVVRLAGQDCRFALEYERTPKAAREYLSVRQRIEQETSIAHFLYLMPNYDLLRFVTDKLSECKRAVHFGLLRDFLQLTLALPVRRNGSPVSVTRCLCGGAKRHIPLEIMINNDLSVVYVAAEHVRLAIVGLPGLNFRVADDSPRARSASR
jgi:hypothetical protein